MHSSIQPVVDALSQRLAELAWKLSQHAGPIPRKGVPRGLFCQNKQPLLPDDCIQDIKQDLERLVAQQDESAARYLAERITLKINVLVHWCRSLKQDAKNTAQPTWTIKSLATRQQWLVQMHQEIVALESQKVALIKTQATLKQQAVDASVMLNIQTELGQLEQKITRAKESLS